MSGDDADFTYRLYAAMERYLAKSGVTDVDVRGFEQRTIHGGYCETCSYEETIVAIRYIDEKDEPGEYVYHGDMGELIRALTDEGHVA